MLSFICASHVVRCDMTKRSDEYCNQSQIQDFPKEGARFRVKCHVDAIQWGGVVAEFFRDLQNPMRFSGGRGVVAEIFRELR